MVLDKGYYSKGEIFKVEDFLKKMTKVSYQYIVNFISSFAIVLVASDTK